jgi:hypothetical protein
MYVARFAVALAAFSLGGCLLFQKPAEPMVLVHASKDLDCPQSEIRATEEFGGKYKAVGCGRKAYYRTACDGLQCVVHGEDEVFVPSHDRPDPLDRAYR